MISLRHKLALGFGGLLAIIAVIGMLTISQIDQLGSAIDVILKQNYRSVTASQEMKEALERMDSDILFSFTDQHKSTPGNIGNSERKFRQALKVELGNITLPGEKEKAERIAQLFDDYAQAVRSVTSDSITLEKKRATYFTTILPLLIEIKTLAQQILDMNQANMNQASHATRLLAASAHNRILIAIISCALLAVLFSYLSRRWILRPVSRLIASAKEIRNGNLDLVLKSESNDEIGELSEAFNEMASTLREVRKRDEETLHRTRKATQEVMNILPTPIAIFNPEGRIDVATQSAIRFFGLNPGAFATSVDYPWLPDMLQRATTEGRAVEFEGNGFLQKFIDNREFFFKPTAVPITKNPNTTATNGTILLLHDVTQVHEQKELKRSVVSTVSHQLRTPLTSLRMAVHLLLERRIGTLNGKQAELLNTACEDSDRLAEMLDDLLDLNRIESGRARLKMQQQKPDNLIRIGIEPFISESKEKGIAIIVDTPPDLPEVIADEASIKHVFANLLSNALRFSQPGSTITVKAEAELSGIRFSVEDTGEGIAPEHMKRVFEQFYRVPGQDEKSGIGLGLSIVKEIINAHGGSVGVKSTKGKGTVFHFTLPA
ncbi:MAG: HAMP domain-containing protein [Chlorobiaceae bacterium]|nr:HAMP domain-containing protein [Chlorobiaceae bacterium]